MMYELQHVGLNGLFRRRVALRELPRIEEMLRCPSQRLECRPDTDRAIDPLRP